MRLLAFFALSAAIAQSASPPAAPRVAAPVDDPAVWRNGGVLRCPQDFRPRARALRLIEVPELPTELADKLGGEPGWTPPLPRICVLPAK